MKYYINIYDTQGCLLCWVQTSRYTEAQRIEATYKGNTYYQPKIEVTA